MTDDEARRIATQAIDTWPNGPKAYVWQNELRELDADTARAAMRRLRLESDRGTTAQFHAAYRAERAARRAADPRAVPEHCRLCQSTGWIEALAHETGMPDGYSAAKPCRCSSATQSHHIVERCAETNRWPERRQSA